MISIVFPFPQVRSHRQVWLCWALLENTVFCPILNSFILRGMTTVIGSGGRGGVWISMKHNIISAHSTHVEHAQIMTEKQDFSSILSIFFTVWSGEAKWPKHRWRKLHPSVSLFLCPRGFKGIPQPFCSLRSHISSLQDIQVLLGRWPQKVISGYYGWQQFSEYFGQHLEVFTHVCSEEQDSCLQSTGAKTRQAL